ncbi:MAG TPA: glycosyltransferase [Solirubrobacteraceae bacterium]|nr:glycosyltransferase [Solirubrobacteraceae bacterium]
MCAPDVIVAWLQHDYGQLGRPSEAIAHALVRSPEVGRVAYVEPFLAGPGLAEPELAARDDRGLLVFSGRGAAPSGCHEVARGVVGLAELRDPVLLNFGVSPANWWFQYEFAPVCSRTVLVAHDRLSAWEATAPRRGLLERVRTQLIGASDVVCGLSQGSIDDVAGAVYVGHGVDDGWLREGVDALPEPTDLASIPHPRAVYVGALSMRFDLDAVRALAESGVHVVLIGIAPPPELVALAAGHEHVHFLGERPPGQTPAYLLRCDVGIIPHTDEAFTRSMEPHKAYNYAAAGLPTVALHAPYAPALGGLVSTTRSVPEFVDAVARAAHEGPLAPAEVEYARSLTWDRVAASIMSAAAPAVLAGVS